MTYTIGVDIGGTNMRAGIMDEQGDLVHSQSIKTLPERGTDALLADLISLIRQTISEAGLNTSQISMIGVGSPGTPDNARGMEIYASNLPFRLTPIRDVLYAALGLPVYVGNDAGCAALAETKIGAARGMKNAAVITIGTGIGCGIIMDGHIFNGFNNAAGEFGHAVIQLDGEPCPCGRRGCFEMYASATALIRDTVRAMKQHPESTMHAHLNSSGKVSARTAFDAMRQGDEVAGRLVETYIRYLSEGITNLVNTLMPEILLIGGGVANEGETLLEPIRLFVQQHAYYGEGVPHVQIDKVGLGNEAGMIGAAYMALDSAQQGIVGIPGQQGV